jgi:cell wall-associated NlpC family hydrolase
MSLTSEQRATTRTIIRRYLERCEANQPDIHYSQARPLTSLGDPPSSEFTTDCSGLVISAFRWADIWLPWLVKDPGGYAYRGWGFTGSILETNKRRRVPLDHKFFVGDMALFGPSLSRTTHVTICRRNGNTQTAIFTSHGSERGPYATRLLYRRDLLCVVRAESLA